MVVAVMRAVSSSLPTVIPTHFQGLDQRARRLAVAKSAARTVLSIVSSSASTPCCPSGT